MVEVFKTDVHDPGQAQMLTHEIHHQFADYRANFDLDDCDKILRVQSATGLVRSTLLIGLLNDFGFRAELLSDETPVLKTAAHSVAKYVSLAALRETCFFRKLPE